MAAQTILINQRYDKIIAEVNRMAKKEDRYTVPMAVILLKEALAARKAKK